ncbi:MAG: ATP-binding protein [Rhodocyclaceae bacterium]|nr:ATP-binding protein [Rhodocyclaceae bacterium]
MDLEKCRLLFQNAGVAQAVVAINGAVLVFILGGMRPPAWALAWLLAVFVVAALRYQLSRRFLGSRAAAADAALWRQRAIRWARIAGLLWAGGGTALMIADPDATRLFTALVIAGMVSGAVPILSSVPQAFRGYAVPVMLAIILTAALDAHGARDWMLALVATLYLLALLKSARYFHDSLDSSIRLALNMQLMAAELERARRGAEASSNAKSQFLATMSHEIRTPLNGILGMAQVLLKPDLDADERQDYTRTILNSGQTLLMLLNDILDLSKVEAGKLELNMTTCDLGRIVADTAALFAESAHRKNLSIEATCRCDDHAAGYWADANRLRQMLSNLINNAIKFTARGFIRIEARELSRDDGEAVLELAVTDSGIGIPSDQQALLFRPFVQVDNSNTREFGGTGLGLSIVRQLAELMNGTVGVDSEPGKGSRFWFRVRVGVRAPGAQPEHADSPLAAVPERAPAAGQTRGVLVVEDNAVNRKVVGAMLTKLGLTVEYVDNGQRAVDAIGRGLAPHLILMDCQMPVMDGFAATQAIRAWELAHGRTRVPIIALTAGAFDEDREHCLAVGMDDFLTKPISLAELGTMLDRWLSIADANRPGAGQLRNDTNDVISANDGVLSAR